MGGALNTSPASTCIISSRQNPRFIFCIQRTLTQASCNAIKLITFIFRTLNKINVVIKNCYAYIRMLIKVNNSPTYYDNELIYSTYRETVHSSYAKKCVFAFTPST